MTRFMDEQHSGFDPDFDREFTDLRRDITAFIHVIEVLMWCRQQKGMAADPNTVRRLTGMVEGHLARRIESIYNL
jgi:hypothetical protein